MAGAHDKFQDIRHKVTRYYAPVSTKIYDIGMDTSRDLDIYPDVYARECVETAIIKYLASAEHQENH